MCNVSPYNGVLEAQLVGGLFHLLHQPGLRADQVLDKLRHPPHGWVSVKPLKSVRKVFRDGQGQVWGTRVQAVHDGQLYDLNIPIVCFTYRQRHKTMSGKDKGMHWRNEILQNGL